jgi:hypothetical protein
MAKNARRSLATITDVLTIKPFSLYFSSNWREILAPLRERIEADPRKV